MKTELIMNISQGVIQHPVQ